MLLLRKLLFQGVCFRIAAEAIGMMIMFDHDLAEHAVKFESIPYKQRDQYVKLHYYSSSPSVRFKFGYARPSSYKKSITVSNSDLPMNRTTDTKCFKISKGRRVNLRITAEKFRFSKENDFVFAFFVVDSIHDHNCDQPRRNNDTQQEVLQGSPPLYDWHEPEKLPFAAYIKKIYESETGQCHVLLLFEFHRELNRTASDIGISAKVGVKNVFAFC
jgi:hypothetical protein